MHQRIKRLCSGTSPQTTANLMITSSTERKTPPTARRSPAGPTHSDGLMLVMMIWSSPNKKPNSDSPNQVSILQLILTRATTPSSTNSSNSETTKSQLMRLLMSRPFKLLTIFILMTTVWVTLQSSKHNNSDQKSHNHKKYRNMRYQEKTYLRHAVNKSKHKIFNFNYTNSMT